MVPGVPGSLVGGSVDYRETPCCLLAWLNRRRIPLNGGRGERRLVALSVSPVERQRGLATPLKLTAPSGSNRTWRFAEAIHRFLAHHQLSACA